MIPVTVIGGYLGAGKTTLINRLLQGGHGRRLAVLVNDFGAINIDAELIASHDGDTISLTNGCVCCTITDALGDALDKVAEGRPKPEQIVIEASGIADPAKIAIYGRGWPGLRLDAVVTLADGETIRARAHDKFVGKLVRRQIAAADVVILSKVDLLDSQARHDVGAWIAEIAPGAQIVEAIDGDVPTPLLLEAGPATRAGAVLKEDGHDHGEIFTSLSFTDPRPFDRARLGALLDSWPVAVWRAKGLVFLRDEPGRIYLLQRVGKRWSLDPDRTWGDQPPTNRLVIIGITGSFDEQRLDQDLASALV
jgi:G3E family GTPase